LVIRITAHLFSGAYLKHLIIILTILFSYAVTVDADLNLIGQGTSTHGTYNLIYDTDLDITWYDYTHLVGGWDNQMDWASALSVTFGTNTYTNWRLPMIEIDCSSPTGWGCTGGEIGHLYYTELGNVYTPTSDRGLNNRGDFNNLQNNRLYWSRLEHSNTISAWMFNTGTGQQGATNKTGNLYAIAVMDGRAVAPEPVSSTLFLIGGAALGLRRFRK